MGLNLDIIGKNWEPVPFSYDTERVILYALGIGAGLDELDFIYEKDLKVFPTFAVIPFLSAWMRFIDNGGLNPQSLIHGAHKIVLHRLIPRSGTINTSGICTSIHDKGDKGAILNVKMRSKDENDQLLFENHVVLLDRSAGNFGGEPGPKAERLNPPEGKQPDFHVRYTTSPNQAALYRLNGDTNPIHIDPESARRAGLGQPILHGLCTFGFAGRAILHSVCESDPARFKSFSASFTGFVFPGDILFIEGWKVDRRTYIIQAKNQEGRVVLANAKAEVV